MYHFNQSSYLSPKLTVQFKQKEEYFGVIAVEKVSAGELLGVWSGVILDLETLLQQPEEIRRHSVQVEENHYLVSIKPDEAPDFINHSCEPNAGLNGQICVVAMREIYPGEEVTIDYAMCDASVYDEFECQCGTTLCRGKVSGSDWKRSDLQKRYAGHFSPYIQRKIEQINKQKKVQVNRIGWLVTQSMRAPRASRTIR